MAKYISIKGILSEPVPNGGVSITGNTTLTGILNSTTTDTGALVVSGGVGVAQDVRVGGKLYVDGVILHSPGPDTNFFIGSTSTANIGAYNIAVGENALGGNTNGTHNIALGWEALSSNTSGSNNIGHGFTALANNLGNFNIAVGYSAGSSNTTGINNTFLGKLAMGDETASGQIAIGSGATTTQANSCVIGNASLTEIRSMSNGGCSLGNSTYPFKDLYFSGGIITSFSAGGTIEANRIVMMAVGGILHHSGSTSLNILGVSKSSGDIGANIDVCIVGRFIVTTTGVIPIGSYLNISADGIAITGVGTIGTFGIATSVTSGGLVSGIFKKNEAY